MQRCIKKNKKIGTVTFLGSLATGILLGCFFVPSPAFAQSADSIKQVSVSASLFGNDSKVIYNGEYEVRFAIYSSDRTEVDPYPSNRDTKLWEETHTVTVKNGLFKVFLGSKTPLPTALTFANGDFYLGMRIGQDSEMIPRKKIGSVSSAINAQFLQGKTIGTTAGDIAQYNAKGKIDIHNLPTGEGSKQLVLGNDSRFGDVHQQNTDTGTDSEFFNIGSGTPSTNNNFDLTVSSDTAAPTLRYNGTSGQWEFSNDGTTFIGVSGGVDPDTLDFSEFKDALTLDASTDISVTGTNYLSITNSGTGYSFLVNDAASDTTPFVIDTDGNVGVGTSAPSAKLSIDASGADTMPLSIKTNGSAGNYTATNSGIYMYDAAGNEMLRIVAGDPNVNNYNSLNLYVGYQTGFSNPTDNSSAGYANNGFGSQALYANTTGSYNSAFGVSVLASNTTGSSNSSFGNDSLFNNTTGDNNSAFGVAALGRVTTGDYSSAFGTYGLYYLTTGGYNTSIGGEAGYNPTNNIAQYRIVADTNMTLIGYGATKDNSATLTNGIAIGSGAHVLESNQVVLGNDDITSTLLKGAVSVRETLWVDQYRESSNSQYNTASNALNGSSTGATWIEAGTDVLATGTSNHASLVYDGKMWMIGGWIGSRTEKVYSSIDGITWTEAGTDALPTGISSATALVYDGKMWLIGGTTSSGNTRKVYSSTDGITWTESGTDALPVATSSASSLVYDGKMWLIGGETAGGDTRKVYYSTNGSSWTEAGTNALPVGTSYHSSLVYDGKMWVIGGWVTTGGTEKVYYSTDGITWTEAGTDALSVDSYSHKSVVYDGKMWVIGGWVDDGNSQSAKVYTSTNGTSWTEVGSDVLPAAISNQGLIVFDGKIWTIAGDNGGNSRKVYYTTSTIRGGLAITTNGSAGNYTATNSGIFMYDAAGTETLRLVATDPNTSNYNSANLYIGYQAGASNPSDNSSAGYSNTGVGYQALYANTTGYSNSAFGFQALAADTVGGSNSAFGTWSLGSNISGSDNVAVGQSALYFNTTGNQNTAIGVTAGSGASQYRIVADTEMTLIGYGATKDNASTLTNGIAIGSGAHVLESNQVVLGNDSITTTLLKGSVGIGTNTPSAKLDISNTSVGTGSELVTNGTFTGSAAGWTLGSNVAYGTNNVTSTYAGGDPSLSTTFATVAGQTYLLTFTVSGANHPVYYYLANNTLTYDEGPTSNGTVTFAFQSNYTGTETIVFDDWFYQSGDTWTIDDVSIKQTTLPSPSLQVDGFNGQTWLSLGGDTQGNTGLGISSLQSNTTGYSNTAYGAYTLNTNTTGASNAAFGTSALQFNTTGPGNVALGGWALFSNTTGNNSTATGNLSLYLNTTGIRNTAYGAYTLLNNTTGTYNIALGYQAGMNETTGSGNILIGTATSSASYGQVTTGSNNISIGYNVAVASSTASNQLNIGNLIYGTGLDGTGATLSSGNIGIGVTSPAEKLSIYPGLTGRALNIYDNGSGMMGFGIGSSEFEIGGYSNGASQHTSFGHWSGAAKTFVEQMRLDHVTGSVGIGDTTPDGLLDIEPTGAVTAASYGINLSNLTTNVTTDAINKYGAYITSTGSWTGSAGTATNNYGLYVDTVSGADNNYGAYFAQNVGIGTTSPSYPLQAQSGSNYIALDPAESKIRMWNNGSLDGIISASYPGFSFNTSITSTSSIIAQGSLISSPDGGNNGLAAGTLDLWSAAGNSTFISFTEKNVANRGTFGFAGGSGDLTYRYGATTMANGTEYFRITSTGNVGIGDTTPDGLLDIEPTGAVTAASYGINLSNLTTNATTDAINKYGAYITSTGSWTGSAGTATNNYGLYVDTVSGADNNYGAYFAQNVGIGAVAPVEKLEIDSSVLNSETSAANIRFGYSGGPTAYYNSITNEISANPATQVMHFNLTTNFVKTNTLSLVGNGNVNITGSNGKLSVVKTSAVTSITQANDYIHLGGTEQLVTNSLTVIGFDGYGSTHNMAYMGAITTDTNQYGAGGLVFGTRNVTTDTAPTERMRVDSLGNVGIGDTTPDGLLDIEPTGAVTAANYGINLSNLTTNGTTDAINKYGAYITSTGTWTGSAGTATNNYGLYVDTVSGADNNYGAYFAQNVGIGTASPSSALEVYGNSGPAYVTISSLSGVQSTGIKLANSGTTNWTIASQGAAVTNLRFSSASSYINLDASTNITFDSSGNRTIGIDTQTNTAQNGNQLTLSAGGSGSQADKSGGDLVLSSGASTGSAYSSIQFQTPTPSVSGVTANTVSTKMTILGSGSVGIGDTTPSYKLEVATDIASDYIANFFNDGNTDTRYGIQIQAGADDASGTTYYLNALDGDGGQVGYIANTSGTFALTDVSDIRTKTNITDTRFQATPLLNDLRVVDFNRKSNVDGPLITGFIAQEVLSVYPNAVTENEAGLLGIMKDAFIPLLVKGFQENDARLTEVENTLSVVELKTNQNITTLADLQISVDEQLTVIGNSLQTLTDKDASIDAQFVENESHLDTIDNLIEQLNLDLNTEASKTALLQAEVTTLTEQVSTLSDFYTTFDLGSVIRADVDGNVELAGKLKAKILETGALVIEVVDADAPTIGSATITPVVIDTDNDGKDDDTGSDGKSVRVKTTAVNGKSRIFVTPNTKDPVVWSISDRTQGEDFTIQLAVPTTDKVRFDWWIVDETTSLP